MLLLLLSTACSADTAAPESDDGVADDSDVSSQEEIAEGIEEAMEPEDERDLALFKHFHGEEEVSDALKEFEQQLIQEKAEELQADLKEEERVAKKAKAKAVAKAEVEQAELEAAVKEAADGE